MDDSTIGFLKEKVQAHESWILDQAARRECEQLRTYERENRILEDMVLMKGALQDLTERLAHLERKA